MHRDLAELISAAQTEFAANPWEPTIQDQLRALLELQNILKSQQLPPDQIQQVQDRVSQLYAGRKAAVIVPQPAPVAPPPVAPPSLPQQQSDLQALMSSNALAQILASAALSKQQPPSLQTPSVALTSERSMEAPSSQPSMTSILASAGAESSLLASLRAAGILPNIAQQSNGVSQPMNAFTYAPPPSMTQTPPMPSLSNFVRSSALEARNDVRLSSASLKTYVSFLSHLCLFF